MIETPLRSLILRIVSSAESPRGMASDTPSPITCPSRVDISIPGRITISSLKSLARTLWSVIAKPSSPRSLQMVASCLGDVNASLDLLVCTCRSSFSFKGNPTSDTLEPGAKLLGIDLMKQRKERTNSSSGFDDCVASGVPGKTHFPRQAQADLL